MCVFVSKSVFSTEHVFEIWGVPKISKPMSAIILWMGPLCKICAADPRDLAAKFPKNSGTWGSWLGLGLAGPLWAAVGPELKKVEGPEFPPWGAGPTPVTLLPPEGEYPEFVGILLVGLVVLGVSTKNRAASCPLGVIMGARRDGALASIIGMALSSSALGSKMLKNFDA